MATIKDVARAAGVSTATVSYVLNDSAPVSPTTRERVLAAAQQLNYQPNQLARNLQNQRSTTLALVLPPFEPEIDLGGLLRACVARATQAGYAVLVTALASDQSLAELAQRTLERGMAAGCILLQPHGADQPLNGPCVWATWPPHGTHAPAVVCDGALAAQRAVHAFQRSGRQRIGLVLAATTAGAARWYLGYRRALKAGRLPFDPELVVQSDTDDLAAGHAAGEALFAGAPLCDAVIVAGGALAVGVQQAHLRASAHAESLQLIAGFDTPLVAGAGLSALVWPVERWGQLLVEQLLNLLNGHTPPQRTCLEPSLIVRST